ncbi:hypothetical protein AB0I53_22425 [Saccharopolyspora sp. NPDC050389]|uniref:terpene synthase family protein n=1 Tax=Saccharopolyspora sp. NPDC050389 TaxID=3155516 RepID=UPI0033F03193
MPTFDLAAQRIGVPFSPARSPHAAVLDANLTAWLNETSVVGDGAVARRVRAACFSDLIASVYPQAGCSELNLIGRLIVWMFVYDDHFDPHRLGLAPDRAHQAADQLARVLRSSGSPGSHEPLWHALDELWHQGFREVDPLLRERLADHLLVFARGVALEVSMRVDQKVPLLDAYIDLRLDTFAWLVLVDLIEVAEGIAVPQCIRNTDTYADLIRTTGRMMFLINDLYSLNKEIAAGETHNIVFVLQRKYGNELSEAFAKAVDLFRNDVVRFIELRTRLERMSLSQGERIAVSRHVRALEHIVRGELDWCRESARYRTGPESGAANLDLEERPML